MEPESINQLARFLEGGVTPEEIEQILECGGGEADAGALLSAWTIPISTSDQGEVPAYPVTMAIRAIQDSNFLRLFSCEGAVLETGKGRPRSIVEMLLGSDVPCCALDSLRFTTRFGSAKTELKALAFEPGKRCRFSLRSEGMKGCTGQVEVWQSGVLLKVFPRSALTEEFTFEAPAGPPVLIKASHPDEVISIRIAPGTFQPADWVAAAVQLAVAGNFEAAANVLRNRLIPLMSSGAPLKNIVARLEGFSSLLRVTDGVLQPLPIMRAAPSDPKGGNGSAALEDPFLLSAVQRLAEHLSLAETNTGDTGADSESRNEAVWREIFKELPIGKDT